jgi:hypothetical protein
VQGVRAFDGSGSRESAGGVARFPSGCHRGRAGDRQPSGFMTTEQIYHHEPGHHQPGHLDPGQRHVRNRSAELEPDVGRETLNSHAHYDGG